MPEFLKARLNGINGLFVATVLLPTLLAILYFGLIASDVYISESRFVVRSPDRQAPSALGLILKGAGFSAAQDEIYTVSNFVQSRDALQELDKTLNVREAFSNPDIDIFSRFSGLGWDNSFEALHRYYQGKVALQHDGGSPISSLTVRAFSAQDAVGINQKLLELSEALVNRLNTRGRQDLIRFASAEVTLAQDNAKAAALALAAYRNAKGVVDPERQATLQLQQAAKLQDELIATQTMLAQLKAFTPQNPQIPALQNRSQSLQTEIDKQADKVTGGDQSLSNKAAAFQRLALEREFADRQLASALASLEQARNEANRQQVYLERIAQPSTPDMAMEPRRLRGILSTLLLGLVAWGILSMLLAGVREHRD